MLAVLCWRPKPWILASLSLFAHGSAGHHHYNHHHHHHHHRHSHHSHHYTSRLVQSPIQFADLAERSRRRHHSTACQLSGSSGSGAGAGAASIWHAILPSGAGRGGDYVHRLRRLPERKGEGSWNVAWDARPARWLHRPDSAWLLFGVCACLAPNEYPETNQEAGVVEEKTECRDSNGSASEDGRAPNAPDYKITGVLADGRCLFRAIAHGACLRNGDEAPDENRQRELADDLRVQVVDELLKRRKETEWFIEGDFDTYVKEIQQPYTWGGEPELLMASHVLKTQILVFMRARDSGNLVRIANYGQEYQEEGESPISLLFHGYGHYELLETLPEHHPQALDA